MKESNRIKSFGTIARQYKALKAMNPDTHINFCLEQKYLSDVIKIASKSVNKKNKIHKHQRRIGRTKLNIFAEKLVLMETEISEAKNFDDILNILNKVHCKGIASLTKYDISIRIGSYLNLLPDKIYLHAGTRVGVSRILGKVKEKEFITIEDLPKEFREYNFTASEYEDIICIFKNDFQTSFNINPNASNLILEN